MLNFAEKKCSQIYVYEKIINPILVPKFLYRDMQILLHYLISYQQKI